MSMKAIAIKAHGDEKQLELFTMPRPVPSADEALIKVHGFALNPVRLIMSHFMI